MCSPEHALEQGTRQSSLTSLSARLAQCLPKIWARNSSNWTRHGTRDCLHGISDDVTPTRQRRNVSCFSLTASPKLPPPLVPLGQYATRDHVGQHLWAEYVRWRDPVSMICSTQTGRTGASFRSPAHPPVSGPPPSAYPNWILPVHAGVIWPGASFGSVSGGAGKGNRN